MPRDNKLDAVDLAELGWYVMPLHTWNVDHCDCNRADCTSPAKHPRTKNGLKDAKSDPVLVAKWWELWPHANIGVRTGGESGLVVVDVDPRHGGDERWISLMQEHDYSHVGPICITGSGGLHLYFQHPGQEVKNSAGLIAEGVDVRGDGGYVVVPSSNHMSGAMYDWSDTFDPWNRGLPPLPDWLLEAMQRPKAEGHIAPPVDAMIPEGKRRAALLSLGGSMRSRGMGETAIRNALLAENQEKCSPPLEQMEVMKLAHDIVTRYEPTVATVLPSSGGKAALKRRELAYKPDPMSFASLKTEQIPDIRWGVPGLLPEGIAILAGAAKLGKSYWSLAVLCQLGEGEDVLSYFPCPVGDGLYVALEDGKRRLRDRLKELLPGKGWPGRAYYETRWPRIDMGGGEALAAWLGQHPEARLVIIDTFALFKPDNGGKSRGDVYAEDYAAIRAVKEIADQYGVCILLITHLNKGDHADWVNTMTGSTGLSGSADTLLNMARPENDRSTHTSQEATLRLTGRDVMDAAWSLKREGGWWKVIGDMEEAAEEKADHETVHFMQAMFEDGFREVTPQQYAQFTNKRIGTARQTLNRAATRDVIHRLRYGVYALRNTVEAPRNTVEAPRNTAGTRFTRNTPHPQEIQEIQGAQTRLNLEEDGNEGT